MSDLHRLSAIARRAQAAVTYIEVLVVIVIIGLLTAVALPAFAQQEDRAHDSVAQQNLQVALRAAQASTEGDTATFPAFETLVERMRASEPSLEIAALPSLFARATTRNDVYVVREGTDTDSVLLAAKSESGLLHTLLWERGETSAGKIVQPTYEQLVKGLGPSAYWPLATDLNDRSPNGWTLTGAPQPGSGPAFLYEDPSPSTHFPGNQHLDSNYTTRRNEAPNPSFELDATGWSRRSGATQGGVTSVIDATAPVGNRVAQVHTPGLQSFEGIWRSNHDSWRIPVEAQTTYTFSAWVKAPAGHQMSILIVELFKEGGQATNATHFTGSSQWQRVSVSYTTTERTDSKVDLRITPMHAAIHEQTFWVDGILFEKTNQLRPYFDGSGHFTPTGAWVDATSQADKRTGWSGDPHSSASAYGVFADGTQRTFIVWARSAGDDAYYSMLGNHMGTWAEASLHIRQTPAPMNALQLNLGAGAFRYANDSWPGPGTWAMVAVVVDELTDQVEAYVNGRWVGEPNHNPGAWDWNDAAERRLRVGQASGSPRWNGDLGQVAVFERALTASQICSLWHAGVGEECF